MRGLEAPPERFPSTDRGAFSFEDEPQKSLLLVEEVAGRVDEQDAGARIAGEKLLCRLDLGSDEIADLLLCHPAHNHVLRDVEAVAAHPNVHRRSRGGYRPDGWQSWIRVGGEERVHVERRVVRVHAERAENARAAPASAAQSVVGLQLRRALRGKPLQAGLTREKWLCGWELLLGQAHFRWRCQSAETVERARVC